MTRTATLTISPGGAGARGLVRMARGDLVALALRSGDTVRLRAGRTAHGRAVAADLPAGTATVDGALARMLDLEAPAPVEVAPVELPPLATVLLSLGDGGPAADPRDLADALFDMALTEGDRLVLALPGGRRAEVEAVSTTPAAGLFGETTVLTLATPPDRQRGYQGIGGLDRQIAEVHEMIALPLSRPDLFAHLGLPAPRGVLFSGPPGSGKTLLARAVAARSDAAFFHIDGPEIVSKHYGDSEAALRRVFEAAAKKAPAVVFIDEIDAIAPRRDGLSAEKQVERRVVAQLLTLLDGLDDRGRVVVMAATNLPDAIDPALRRPGRFDREIAFRPPTAGERASILRVHLAAAPLSPDADLALVADRAHGYVGADLAALAREAAMAALRRASAEAGGPDGIAAEHLTIGAADLAAGLAATRPSALRGFGADPGPVRWSDLGGATAVRAELERAVLWPLRHGAAMARLGLSPARGVLLTGPPGAGKTLAARALATEAGVNFIAVRAPRLLSQYLGEAERALAELFDKARATAPSILFFDEIDALAPRRGGRDAVLDRMVAELLVEFDGLGDDGGGGAKDAPGITVMAATNRPGALDPALTRPGRFDVVIELGLPDRAQRAEILSVHLSGRPVADDVDPRAIAGATEGASGADLAALVRDAARDVLARAAGGAPADALVLTARDLHRAVDRWRAAEAHRRADHLAAPPA